MKYSDVKTISFICDTFCVSYTSGERDFDAGSSASHSKPAVERRFTILSNERVALDSEHGGNPVKV
jgi:hypothetical protein